MYTPDINAFDADVQRQYRDYYKDFTDKYGFTPTEYSSLLFWQLEEYYSGINGLTSAPIWKSVEKSYFLVEKKNTMKKLQDWSRGYMNFKASRNFNRRMNSR